MHVSILSIFQRPHEKEQGFIKSWFLIVKYTIQQPQSSGYFFWWLPELIRVGKATPEMDICSGDGHLCSQTGLQDQGLSLQCVSVLPTCSKAFAVALQALWCFLIESLTLRPKGVIRYMLDFLPKEDLKILLPADDFNSVTWIWLSYSSQKEIQA